MATGGPLAWGLCYNREMSPSQSYCDDSYKFEFPCAPGVEYYGRGAIPVYWCVPFCIAIDLTTILICLLHFLSHPIICILPYLICSRFNLEVCLCEETSWKSCDMLVKHLDPLDKHFLVFTK